MIKRFAAVTTITVALVASLAGAASADGCPDERPHVHGPAGILVCL